MYAIMYHYVRKLKGSRYPGIKGLELELFRQQLDFLEQNGFQFVTMEDVLSGNFGKNSVLLSFDDGYIDHYTNVFPLLDQRGIQGVFSMPGKIIREKKVLDVNKVHFVLASGKIEEIKKHLLERMDYYRGSEFSYPSNEELYGQYGIANRFDDGDTIFVKRMLQTALPEKLRNIISDEMFRDYVTDCEEGFADELYLSMDQIKTMKKHGMYFAFHGYDHYWMNHMQEQDTRKDIEQAMDVFDGILDSQNWVCCYPYGSCDEQVVQIVKDMGACGGLTTKVDVYQPENYDLFNIPRLDTNDFPPKSRNYLNF